MHTLTSKAFVFAVLAAGLLSCGTAAPGGHVHRHTATVTVTENGLLPGPTVSIPTFATVVWRNRGTHDLTIEVDAATCPDCDTVLGFAAGDHGARSTTVSPGAVVTLCFHEAGTFPYTARLGGVELRGSIDVGGAR